MGVSGLMTYCNERRKDISQRVDLVQVARQHHERNGSSGPTRNDGDTLSTRSTPPLTILVDYYAFESYILPKFLLSERERESGCKDPNLRLFGGEYAPYDAFVRRFLEALLGLGVVFTFFIDSSRGSSPDVAAHKLETWKDRFRETLVFFDEIREVCEGRKEAFQLRDKLVRPCLLTVQTLLSIEQAGCEIVPCLYDEADSVISHQLLNRPGAFAVLSHDSDFAVMRGSRFIPIDWFDINGHLIEFVLGKKQVIPSLFVDITTPESIAFSLGLPSPSCLVELAILKGNDFTKPFLKNMNLRQHLGLRNFSLQNFAGWVQRYGTLERSDYFWHAMKTDADFRSAVNHSREFYSSQTPHTFRQNQQQRRQLRPHPDVPPPPDPLLSSLIETGISRGEYPIIFLAMHRGFYWHRELLCDPNVEVALSDLRKCLYDLIVPSTVTVSEYYRDEDDMLQRNDVRRAGKYPSLSVLSSSSSSERLSLFTDFFLTSEGDGRKKEKLASTLSEFEDVKHRFVILILRYFLNLTRRSGFALKESETEAVVASVCHSLSRRETLRDGKIIVPTFRCLTAFTWLQEVYLYGYNLIGKALRLHHLFPHPRDIFQGSIFVRYFQLGVRDVRAMFPEQERIIKSILVEF